MLTRFLMAGLLVLGLSSGARAADREDLQIFRNISTQVLRYSYFTIFDSVHARGRTSARNGRNACTARHFGLA